MSDAVIIALRPAGKPASLLDVPRRGLLTRTGTISGSICVVLAVIAVKVLTLAFAYNISSAIFGLLCVTIAAAWYGAFVRFNRLLVTPEALVVTRFGFRKHINRSELAEVAIRVARHDVYHVTYNSSYDERLALLLDQEGTCLFRISESAWGRKHFGEALVALELPVNADDMPIGLVGLNKEFSGAIPWTQRHRILNELLVLPLLFVTLVILAVVAMSLQSPP